MRRTICWRSPRNTTSISIAWLRSGTRRVGTWLCGLQVRKWLDGDDPLRGEAPLPLNGVVALAGITDLAAYSAPDGCGAAVEPLLGGPPSDVRDRLQRASPIGMVPFGITQILVIGELDPIVPSTQATSFAEAALEMGDSVEVVEIAGAGHFELVDPSHAAFQTVRDAVLEAITPGWTE